MDLNDFVRDVQVSVQLIWNLMLRLRVMYSHKDGS